MAHILGNTYTISHSNGETHRPIHWLTEDGTSFCRMYGMGGSYSSLDTEFENDLNICPSPPTDTE